MKLIKHLAEQIKEESEGVINYATDALEYKAKKPELAALYYELANVEYGHVQKLHDQVVKEIELVKASGVEIPDVMFCLWDDAHKELIKSMAEAKVVLDMYKAR